MNEKLLEALDQISDSHIAEAAAFKRRRTVLRLRWAAAVLAVVLVCAWVQPWSAPASATELVSPAEYTPAPLPDEDDYADTAALDAAMEVYWTQRELRIGTREAALEDLGPFWAGSFREFLTGEENGVWSPVNAYMALAMLAQTSAGTTRQEILDALGAETIEQLRSGVKVIWETVNADSGETTRTLANSLWLDKCLRYRKANLDILGTDYYAAVYRTDLRSADDDIQAWIDRQTGGILEPIGPAEETDAQKVLTLVSTIYLRDAWLEPFEAARSTPGVFHSPDGDVECTYMNDQKDSASYCRGSGYTAVGLPTGSGCMLWLVLPDEDSSLPALLESGAYLDTVLDRADVSSAECRLSMPKFDISSTLDLTDGLQRLGIREVFSSAGGDFSDTLSLGGPIYADAVRQSARIIVNESGIEAASATSVTVLVKSPTEPVRVVFDRPFLFVVTCQDIPLFAGTVTEP